jgi:hypothetical protein
MFCRVAVAFVSGIGALAVTQVCPAQDVSKRLDISRKKLICELNRKRWVFRPDQNGCQEWKAS